MYFGSATPPGAPPAPPPRVQPVPQPSRQTLAASAILAEDSIIIRKALSDYFAGEFDSAIRKFTDLSVRQPKNAWIWAFLGASQYSLGAFELNETYKSQAMDSFRKAKTLRPWKGGLPEKYFSKRIRNVFKNAG
jgi:predicted Zn-dependent protease